MTFGEIEEEMEKCKNNPYYFYTTYITIDGKKPEVWMSEEDFNGLFKTISFANEMQKDIHSIIKKR